MNPVINATIELVADELSFTSEGLRMKGVKITTTSTITDEAMQAINQVVQDTIKAKS